MSLPTRLPSNHSLEHRSSNAVADPLRSRTRPPHRQPAPNAAAQVSAGAGVSSERRAQRCRVAVLLTRTPDYSFSAATSPLDEASAAR